MLIHTFIISLLSDECTSFHKEVKFVFPPNDPAKILQSLSDDVRQYKILRMIKGCGGDGLHLPLDPGHLPSLYEVDIYDVLPFSHLVLWLTHLAELSPVQTSVVKRKKYGIIPRSDLDEPNPMFDRLAMPFQGREPRRRNSNDSGLDLLHDL